MTFAATSCHLLMVDVQPVFVQTLAAPEAYLRRCKFALEAARLLGLPITLTEQVPDKLGAFDEALRTAVPDVAVIAKTTFSAWPAIAQTKAARTRRNLILTGLETSICIFQTALDALRAGSHVTLLTDAIASRRPEDGAAALSHLLRQPGIAGLPSESLFYALLGDTRHPAFRDYTRLVKAATAS